MDNKIFNRPKSCKFKTSYEDNQNIILNYVDKNSNIFDELLDKKVVVNKSVLNDKDLQDFEKECGIMTFFNIPYLDDKQTDINVISALLEALGFSRIDSGNSGKLFTVFK